MWDSVLCARVAKWVVSCEEEEIASILTDVERARQASGLAEEQSRSEESARKVPETVTEAIVRWLAKLSEHASNADIVDSAGMEGVGWRGSTCVQEDEVHGVSLLCWISQN
jgi:hypothetical protein